jgi:hypothetical protein
VVSSPPPIAHGIAALQGALVLSLGYILQRGTQGIPEVERMRMLYNMIDKVRADLRAIVMTGTHG